MKEQRIDHGGIQSRLKSFEDILSDSAAAEESVVSRFGYAEAAREQIEQTKIQFFNQLTTAQAIVTAPSG